MNEEPVPEGAHPPAAGGQPPSRSSNALAIAGWITAVFFWPASIVIGGILASRDDKRGRWILGVAIAIGLIWIVAYLVLLNAAEDQVIRDYYENY